MEQIDSSNVWVLLLAQYLCMVAAKNSAINPGNPVVATLSQPPDCQVFTQSIVYAVSQNILAA